MSLTPENADQSKEDKRPIVEREDSNQLIAPFKEFFTNPHYMNKLCFCPAATGSGKTYAAVNAVVDSINEYEKFSNGDIRTKPLYIFLNPQTSLRDGIIEEAYKIHDLKAEAITKKSWLFHSLPLKNDDPNSKRYRILSLKAIGDLQKEIAKFSMSKLEYSIRHFFNQLWDIHQQLKNGVARSQVLIEKLCSSPVKGYRYTNLAKDKDISKHLVLEGQEENDLCNFIANQEEKFLSIVNEYIQAANQLTDIPHQGKYREDLTKQLSSMRSNSRKILREVLKRVFRVKGQGFELVFQKAVQRTIDSWDESKPKKLTENAMSFLLYMIPEFAMRYVDIVVTTYQRFVCPFSDHIESAPTMIDLKFLQERQTRIVMDEVENGFTIFQDKILEDAWKHINPLIGTFRELEKSLLKGPRDRFQEMQLTRPVIPMTEHVASYPFKNMDVKEENCNSLMEEIKKIFNELIDELGNIKTTSISDDAANIIKESAQYTESTIFSGTHVRPLYTPKTSLHFVKAAEEGGNIQTVKGASKNENKIIYISKLASEIDHLCKKLMRLIAYNLYPPYIYDQKSQWYSLKPELKF